MVRRLQRPRGQATEAHRPVGILGGSFNPPHAGHVDICRQALAGEYVSRVIVVPAFVHPFGKPLAPFEHRMAMARLAFEPFGDRVEVSDIEARLGGISYTIDTVRALRRRHRLAHLRLLIGTDVLPDLPKWKEIEQLLALAPVLVFPRAGFPRTEPPAGLPNIEMVGIQPPRVSSTRIRQRLAAGNDAEDAIPPAVMAYIRQHDLYRAGGQTAASTEFPW